MSHISKIEMIINSLQDLRQACKQLGFEFVSDQKTYQWYGRWVGDAPLPSGIHKEDLGKCDHAIKVPDCKYEIGVVRQDGHFILLWDSWHSGGLRKKIGNDAGVLRQQYAVARVSREAHLRGYRVSQKPMEKKIRLTLSV